MVEACSETQGMMSAVSFYVVPGASTIEVRGRRALGFWTASSNRIVIAESAQLDGPAVRHEMLHAVLRTTEHSRRRFLEQCGGAVGCPVECIADAGPATPPGRGTPVVSPELLVIAVSVTPGSPSMAIDDGFFQLTVRATNTAGYPVVVELPVDDVGGLPRSFSYAAWSSEGGASGGVRAGDAEVWQFSEGETKSHVFDLRIGTERGWLAPGNYAFHGGYGGKEATPVNAVLRP
jgi:hypothetical protein